MDTTLIVALLVIIAIICVAAPTRNSRAFEEREVYGDARGGVVTPDLDICTDDHTLTQCTY